jgi:hypothetical protein
VLASVRTGACATTGPRIDTVPLIVQRQSSGSPGSLQGPAIRYALGGFTSIPGICSVRWAVLASGGGSNIGFLADWIRGKVVMVSWDTRWWNWHSCATPHHRALVPQFTQA